MNLLLFPQIESSSLRIPEHDRHYQHIKNILKSEAQDELLIGHINGQMGIARILEINDQEIRLEVAALDQDPPKPLAVTLILALPRPPMIQRILSAVASLGIKKIYLIQTNRVEKSYWGSHVLNPDEIQKQLIAGLEQAKDTILPDVRLIQRFKPFVQDELPGLSDGSLRLLAHPDPSADSCPVDLKQSVTLFVGPEGGLIPFEVDLLKNAGFQTVHLGPRTLRVETAVTALISKIAIFS